MEPIDFKKHDRVRLAAKPDKIGYLMSIDGRRGVVHWDKSKDGNDDIETINLAMLRLTDKPKMSTFCGYCFINFKLRLANKGTDTKDSQAEEVVANTANGATFHLRCAREIKRSVEAYEMQQLGKDLANGPG